MKCLMFTGGLLLLATTAALGDGMFWVTGNHATGKCDIVTSNPVVAGDIFFADGPYKSRDDAKLARSTISVCPRIPDPSEEKSGHK